MLVDTLAEMYYRHSDLPGAINLPVDEIAARAAELLPDKHAGIAVYCMDDPCPASEMAVRKLAAMGYTNVSNPVWFDWDGEFVKFSQTRTRQKLRNLNRDPRIALSIVDPDNHLRYLEIRGRVEKIEEDPALDFISAMSRKYLDTYPYPFHKPGDERVVLFVRPEHTTHMDG